MKTLSLFGILVTIIFAAGCAYKPISKNYQYYDSPQAPTHKYHDGSKPMTELVIVTSVPDARTKRLFGDKIVEGFSLSQCALLTVDSKPAGDTSYKKFPVYNGGAKGDFKLELDEGKHTFVVGTLENVVIGNESSIEFLGLAGHKYYLGLLEKKEKYRLQWIPVLVDMSTAVVIYPPN